VFEVKAGSQVTGAWLHTLASKAEVGKTQIKDQNAE
jgi:hypothetical protein